MFSFCQTKTTFSMDGYQNLVLNGPGTKLLKTKAFISSDITSSFISTLKHFSVIHYHTAASPLIPVGAEVLHIHTHTHTNLTGLYIDLLKHWAVVLVKELQKGCGRWWGCGGAATGRRGCHSLLLLLTPLSASSVWIGYFRWKHSNVMSRDLTLVGHRMETDSFK